VRRRRAATAALVAVAGAALVVGVALIGAWLAGRAAPQPGIVTQVDQLGDRIAIVQVQGAGASAAADAARASTVRWTLVALGVALVPLLGLGWLVAGRLTPATGGDLDDSDGADAAAALDGEAEQLRVQRDRDRRHLQEVVHELRTPLAVAATNLDLAVTTPGLDADVGSHLAAARRGVERLARTVDDLATHGRLSVGDDGAIDLAVEVRALAGEHGGLARARGLTLHVEGPERLVVAADRAAVHTAVGNLLANAVRLAPSGSIVRLATGTWDEWAWIAVRDEGPGLPDLDHERAFRRYWRGRYDLDRHRRGWRPRPRPHHLPAGRGGPGRPRDGPLGHRRRLDLRGLAATLGRRPHGRRGRARRHSPPRGPAARPPRPDLTVDPTAAVLVSRSLPGGALR